MSATLTSSGTVPGGPDPRPRVVDGPDGRGVAGTRCVAGGHPSLEPVQRCPLCGAESRPTVFARTGTVFSSTVLRIPVGDLQPPLALLYVDLDDGPRVLGHGTGSTVVPPGTRVELSGTTDRGDLRFDA
jgi:uncharacterized OB-fold protein